MDEHVRRRRRPEHEDASGGEGRLSAPQGGGNELESFLAFIYTRRDHYLRLASHLESDPVQQVRHKAYSEIAERFEALAEFLKAQTRKAHDTQPGSIAVPKPGSMRIGNIAEFPEELLQQLSIKRSDQIESDIIEIVTSLGGVAAIDEIIVGLWRKTGEVHKRPSVFRKLYRMMGDQKLWNVPGRKGVYSIAPIPSEASTSGDRENTAEEEKAQTIATPARHHRWRRAITSAATPQTTDVTSVDPLDAESGEVSDFTEGKHKHHWRL